jgi:hypothetical protein
MRCWTGSVVGWRLLGLGIASLSFGAVGCGGGGSDAITSGPSCGELCSAAMHCSTSTDAASCKAQCDEQRAVWNATAWSAYTQCVTGSTCQSLGACMQEAVAATSAAPLESFLGEVCDWAVGCAQGVLSKSQCVTMFRNLGSSDSDAGGASPWDFVRLVRASALSCVSGCIRKLSCTEKDFGGASNDCARSCGLGPLMGTDQSSSSSSSSSFGSSNSSSAGSSCVEQHGDCGAHGKMVENQYGACECQCDADYISVSYVCMPGCQQTGCAGHGDCGPNGVCDCETGYYATPEIASGACSLRPYFVALATAELNTCAVRNDGAVECWGDASGALIKLPDSNQGFVQVAVGGGAGNSDACALRKDGSVACWGNITQPSVALVSLSLDDDAACGVQPDASISCWGFDPFGATSPPALSGYSAVALGGQLSCGVHLDHSLACWGSSAAVAKVPANLKDVAQVCARSGTACARHDDGSVECFGFGGYVSTEVPAPNAGFVDVTCGDYHACALRQDGTAVCWGEIGLPAGAQIPAGEESGYTDLEAGYEHTCGLKQDGSVACWGTNTYGQAPSQRGAMMH